MDTDKYHQQRVQEVRDSQAKMESVAEPDQILAELDRYKRERDELAGVLSKALPMLDEYAAGNPPVMSETFAILHEIGEFRALLLTIKD